MKLLDVITTKTMDAHAGQGHKSKVEVTDVKTKFAPICAFQDCNCSSNSHMTSKSCTKFEMS